MTLPGDSAPQLIAYKDDQLITVIGNNKLFDESVMKLTDDYVVLSDAILFTSGSSEEKAIYQISYDKKKKKYGKPVKVATTDGFIAEIFAVEKDGMRLLTALNQNVTDNTMTGSFAYHTCSISYNLNGGTLAGEPVKSYDSQVGCELSTAIPTRPGYEFAGWFKTPDFNENGRMGTVAQGTAGDLTLYAKWTPIKYTASFSANGGKGTVPANIAMTYGKAVRIGSVNLKKKHYTFAGWSSSKTATKASYKNGGSINNLTTKAGGTAVLYAVWQPVKYKVTFNANGGKVKKKKTYVKNIAYKTAIKKLPSPSRTGYKFMGWYTKRKGGKKISAKTKITGKKTFYARWKKK